MTVLIYFHIKDASSKVASLVRPPRDTTALASVSHYSLLVRAAHLRLQYSAGNGQASWYYHERAEVLLEYTPRRYFSRRSDAALEPDATAIRLELLGLVNTVSAQPPNVQRVTLHKMLTCEFRHSP